MSIHIVGEDEDALSESGEYIAVRTCQDPHDETITLTTIERVVEKTVLKKSSESPWHIKILINEQPMTHDAAIGFATRYAERKNIPVICTEADA